MGISQCRQIFIVQCKLRQCSNGSSQSLFYQPQCFCHNNNIGIISNITRGSSQMNNRSCIWTLFAKCKYMGHYIMTYFFFLCFCHFIINFICILLHFINLFFGNWQAKFHFRFSKGNPQFSPCCKFFIRRK